MMYEKLRMHQKERRDGPLREIRRRNVLRCLKQAEGNDSLQSGPSALFHPRVEVLCSFFPIAKHTEFL